MHASAAVRHVVRALSTATKRPVVGAVFDIDGVLLRGYAPLKGARDSLQRLADHNIPFIFLTNGMCISIWCFSLQSRSLAVTLSLSGGGVLESAKAAQMSELLDWEVQPEQVIVAHSPAQVLVPRFHDKRVRQAVTGVATGTRRPK